MRDIIPIGQREARMPEGGRIRLGVKKGNRPTSIDTFRFTSADAEAIQQIAEAYGGQARPWSAGHGSQWEVVTEANEVRIVLPPDPLSQHYELWSGGGCQRRCDGERVEVPGADGWDDHPCICRRKGEVECKPKTRLNVILPDIKFGGVWRLETSSWYAMDELKGFVGTIAQLQEQQGLTVGLLALEQRQQKGNGQTKNFVVPTLRLSTSVQDVLSGAANVNRLAAPSSAERPSLGTGDSPPVAEAAPGDSQAPGASTPSVPAEGAPDPGEGDGEVSDPEVRRKNAVKRAQAAFREHGWNYEDEVRYALEAVYDGRSLSKLTADEVDALVAALRNPDSRARFEEHFPVEAEVVE